MRSTQRVRLTDMTHTHQHVLLFQISKSIASIGITYKEILGLHTLVYCYEMIVMMIHANY